jgi:uncharacterized protein YcgL (UPF0745 family)
MRVDIYKSTKNGNKYISVPQGTEIEKMKFPENLDPDLLTLSPFKTELEIDPSQPRAALDSADVLKQISENGYAVHGAKVTITLQDHHIYRK